GEMTALTVNNRSICIGKSKTVVIKYFTMLFSSPNHSTPGTFRFYRIGSFYPVGYVNIMHMLLYDMISTKPIEIIPVSHLIFHLGLSSFPWTHPNTAIVPIYLAPDDITNRSIIYSVDGFNIIGLITALQATYNVEFLCFGQLCR